VVYSTGGAWSAHLAALWLKKATGVKWLAEIHDPMVIRSSSEDIGAAIPKNRDARFRQYLEHQIIHHADHIWWFTEGALHYAKQRNPLLNTTGHAHGFVVLPGAEPPGGLASAKPHVYSSKLNLSHFGSLANDRSLSVILQALSGLLKKYPEARKDICIHAYGAALDSLSVEAIKKGGYEDVLIAHGRLEKDPQTGKSGRERVVKKMQEADTLILLHGNDEWCAEYIPSKFYEYLWTGRPIWGITHHNPQLDTMLLERGAYLSQVGEDLQIEATLEKIWLDWKNQGLIEPKWQPLGVDQAVARILAETK
jgi:hypothetical protein